MYFYAIIFFIVLRVLGVKGNSSLDQVYRNPYKMYMNFTHKTNKRERERERKIELLKECILERYKGWEVKCWVNVIEVDE